MADLFENNLILFIIFIIPGFISIKIYEMITPVDKRDFSKSIIEVIVYSCFNYAALSWLIYLLLKNQFIIDRTFLYILIIVFILLIFPILWPILLLKIIHWGFIKKIVTNPIPKPWDYVFLKREPYWIIIHLKNGKMVGGIYNTDSYASLYPIEEQLYLQQVWKLDSNGKFKTPIDRTKGIIVMREDISSIELFK